MSQTINSTIPTTGATGVSPGAAVVFNFSDAMDESQTAAQFFYLANFTPIYLTFVPIWNAGSNVLTCTPVPAFPSGTNIYWNVDGYNLLGDPLTGTASGLFTTGSGGGSTGSGTNALTSFAVGKTWEYNQTSTAAPTLDAATPYLCNGTTVLASNRTANSVTLTMPTSAVSNLVQNFLHPEDYFLGAYHTNLATFNATFPAGNYSFNVSATASNQQVTVNLPAFTQPNAPHVTNYTAAQSINPSQPFTLGWDVFTGGGSTDYVFVVIGNVFQTPGFGQTNALKGNATSVTIPASTLQASSNYNGSIGFYHAVVATNGGYITEAYVGTMTQFSLGTASSAAAPVLTNAARVAGVFAFDILTTTGQTLTVVYNTNLNTASTTWPKLLTTNSPGSKVHVTDPHSTTNKSLFYRARNGT